MRPCVEPLALCGCTARPPRRTGTNRTRESPPPPTGCGAHLRWGWGWGSQTLAAPCRVQPVTMLGAKHAPDRQAGCGCISSMLAHVASTCAAKTSSPKSRRTTATAWASTIRTGRGVPPPPRLGAKAGRARLCRESCAGTPAYLAQIVLKKLALAPKGQRQDKSAVDAPTPRSSFSPTLSALKKRQVALPSVNRVSGPAAFHAQYHSRLSSYDNRINPILQGDRGLDKTRRQQHATHLKWTHWGLNPGPPAC